MGFQTRLYASSNAFKKAYTVNSFERS